MIPRRAVFLDRDGTVCQEVGYVNHPERLALLPGAAAALRRLAAANFVPVIVTNQAGIARGYFPLHVLDQTHRRLTRLLDAEGVTLGGIYACVHHPDVGGPGFQQACDCRKPRPGLLFQAARDLDLDLGASVMIGDSFRDVGAGRAAGVRATVLVRTGYGRGELVWKSAQATVWPDRVADDLDDAATWILALTKGHA